MPSPAVEGVENAARSARRVSHTSHSDYCRFNRKSPTDSAGEAKSLCTLWIKSFERSGVRASWRNFVRNLVWIPIRMRSRVLFVETFVAWPLRPAALGALRASPYAHIGQAYPVERHQLSMIRYITDPFGCTE